MILFGRELRNIREERKLTQGEFARKLSVSMQTYGNIERGALKNITGNMRKIATSDFLTGAEKGKLNKVIAKESPVENTFGNELRRIREGRGLTQAEFSKQLGLNASTYHAVEAGNMGSHTESATRVMHNNGLTQFERLALRKTAEKESRLTGVEITDADRLAYRKRKNEQYAREMNMPQKVTGHEIKRAVPKSFVQKLF